MMQIGIYSFGDTKTDPGTGRPGSTAGAIKDLLEAIRLADEVGLDFAGVGEHHITAMPASSPATVLAAAAATTTSITLGSSVSILGTDDPVRVFQQFATVDALSGGRAEITAGRGSSTASFPLFGYDLADYDRLYAEKLELLIAINTQERVTWSGTVRPSLTDALVVPRPVNGTLPIWLGTGGNSGSSIRAGTLGLPVAYGIIGGSSHAFAPLAELYRRSAAAAGHSDPGRLRVAVASHGFLAEESQVAKQTFFEYRSAAMAGAGRPSQSRAQFDQTASGQGAILAGSPAEITDRILALHEVMGHDRHILQMDVGGMPQRSFLRAIELLGTEVAPAVRAALSTDAPVSSTSD